MIEANGRRCYTPDDEAIPYPPSLAPYLRDTADGLSRHYALLLRHAYSRMPAHTRAPSKFVRGIIGQLTAIVAKESVRSDAVTPLLAALFPIGVCKQCGREWMKQHPSQRYCSAACYDAANHSPEQERLRSQQRRRHKAA